ncbi:Ubiquinone/menaquinone biosynthesis C-methylase UbiE [Jannaschia faecimaris]|uniref:Ubiquinone/menaquinone biosynthesis C-methylase UbiE n=1 Tax=Jannaschia faecimaris TaxID=1244108 RepID=A0A1H3SPN1_9RHOB|nr:class I SAM-dependent methyltransferase [Jannaschia faecimaris]SDZ39956.1 Ubiquinone/menaquinone biosynthesis C-methylase UbiE [Jannaschia faecimaris]
MLSSPTSRPSIRFWDRVAPKYARKPISDPVAYEKSLSAVAALLRTSDLVLEIGCGTGTTALRLAPRVAHYTATDGARGMVEIAQAKLGPDAPANVTFKHADALEMPEATKFEAICAFSLLHVVRDVSEVLERSYRQLKPGGIFISKTVCLKHLNPPMRVMVRILSAIGIAPRLTFLSRDELVALLGAAGFTVERSTYFDAKRMSPFIVARRPAN